MKKINWNEISNILDNNKNDPLLSYKIKSYISNFFSSINEANENYDYWYNKKDILEKFEHFFGLLQSNKIKTYKLSNNKHDKHDELFLELINKNQAPIDFNNITSIEFIKQIKPLHNLNFSFNDYFFENINLDNLLSLNPNIDSFIELCSSKLFIWKMKPENLYLVLEYLILNLSDNNIENEQWKNFSRLTSLQTYLTNNIHNIFNVYLLKKEKEPHNIVHDKILAECLNIAYANNFISSNSSNHFSFYSLITNEKYRIPSLNKMSSINWLKIYSDQLKNHLKESTLFLEKKYADKYSGFLSYKNSLSEIEKFEFYKKFPILLNILHETNIDIVKKLSNEYYQNFEQEHFEAHTKNSSFSFKNEELSHEEKQNRSSKYFLQSFGKNLHQTHLDKISPDDIIYLISKNLIKKEMIIKKNSTIKKFLIKNINEPYEYIPILLNKYINERCNIEKSEKLFSNIKLNSSGHNNVINNLFQIENIFLLTNKKNYLKYEKIAFENIINIIEDETQDINRLTKLMSIDPLLSISFIKHFDITNLNNKFHTHEQQFHIENNENNDFIQYNFSIYKEYDDPIFLRYKVVLKHLVDENLLFLNNLQTTSYYNKNYSAYINKNNLFNTNIETIYCKFHLLNEFYDKMRVAYNDFSDIKSPVFSLINPFKKTNKYYSTNSDGKYLYAPSSILALLKEKELYCDEIINNYNKSIRTIILNNSINQIEHKRSISIKKKI